MMGEPLSCCIFLGLKLLWLLGFLLSYSLSTIPISQKLRLTVICWELIQSSMIHRCLRDGPGESRASGGTEIAEAHVVIMVEGNRTILEAYKR